MNYEIVAKNIRYEFKTYLQNSGLKSIVVGISGGIDSAICVALANPVCRELGVEIIGRSITIESNKVDERLRADLVGNVFCQDYKEVNLTDEYLALAESFDNHEGVTQGIDSDAERADSIRKGNIKARMRMVYLYNIAQLHHGMVLSTDNFTELMLGFWTLHGDVGDYGMLQNLWKMEVYALSRWVADNDYESGGYDALMACVDATPTDGLGITSSDLEQLGVDSYAEADDILKEHLHDLELMRHGDYITSDQVKRRTRYNERMTSPVIQRYYATQFKRNNPYNIPRSEVCWGAE